MKKNLIINYAMAKIKVKKLLRDGSHSLRPFPPLRTPATQATMVVAEQQSGYCSTLIEYIVEHHPISVVQTA